VLVGPSGCGKSTLLRMVAGLETITSGEIDIGGRVVNEIEPADRDIAMVFQNYALYPHMSVYNNMAYGLRNRRTPKPEIDTRVQEAARILELGAMLDRKPRQLSAPSSGNRKCSCSTNPCRISTPSCVSRCASRSANCSGG
jgi:sn-glycerol 3-phosphate transport system ATP-binding protein